MRFFWDKTELKFIQNFPSKQVFFVFEHRLFFGLLKIRNKPASDIYFFVSFSKVVAFLYCLCLSSKMWNFLFTTGRHFINHCEYHGSERRFYSSLNISWILIIISGLKLLPLIYSGIRQFSNCICTTRLQNESDIMRSHFTQCLFVFYFVLS